MTDFDNELIERMERILTATANALHGGYAPPDCLHSWHDLPELVEKLRKERDEARRMWCEAAPVGNSLSVDDMYRRARAEAERRGWDCFKENTDE